MATYLLNVISHAGDDRPTQEIFDKVDQFNKHLKDDGVWVSAGSLEPPDQSTLVVADGDMPDEEFDTRYYVSGMWMIDTGDDQLALSYADEASAACGLPIQVRKFEEI